jgi:hypothetical protein
VSVRDRSALLKSRVGRPPAGPGLSHPEERMVRWKTAGAQHGDGPTRAKTGTYGVGLSTRRPDAACYSSQLPGTSLVTAAHRTARLTPRSTMAPASPMTLTCSLPDQTNRIRTRWCNPGTEARNTEHSSRALETPCCSSDGVTPRPKLRAHETEAALRCIMMPSYRAVMRASGPEMPHHRPMMEAFAGVVHTAPRRAA